LAKKGVSNVIGYRGTVRGRTIELAEELPLPEGAQVEVLVSMFTGAREAVTALKFARMLETLTDHEKTVFGEALKRRPTFAKRLSL